MTLKDELKKRLFKYLCDNCPDLSKEELKRLYSSSAIDIIANFIYLEKLNQTFEHVEAFHKALLPDERLSQSISSEPLSEPSSPEFIAELKKL